MLIDIKDFDFVHFAGGEVHLNAKEFFKVLPKEKTSNTPDVIWSPIRNSVDLMELLVLTDAYKRYYMETPRVCIPYIPYARQDRVANVGESLSIKVFADIINSQNYPLVYVLDPHSEVCMALLNNVKVLKNIDDIYLSEIIPNYNSDYVVLAPDAGSFKRLGKVIKDVPLIYATKQRDTKTGALSNVEIHTGGLNFKNRKILVVDDICDGGGTFLLLAEALRRAGIDNILELYVSHGIFSKGINNLIFYYSKIYTTNSFYQDNSEKVTIKDLKQYLK